MDNIEIPYFSIEGIKEYIYRLFNKYTKQKNANTYSTEKFMIYMFKELNIDIEIFVLLFKRYIDPKYTNSDKKNKTEYYDLMMKYNFSKILSFYIYTNCIKRKIFKGLNNVNIDNISFLINDLNIYKNMLLRLKNLIFYTKNNILENLDLGLESKINDLSLIFKCIYKFINVFWNENRKEIKVFLRMVIIKSKKDKYKYKPICYNFNSELNRILCSQCLKINCIW